MAKISQNQRIANLLKAHPGEKFTSRQLAHLLVDRYPEEYAEKRRNPRFSTDDDLKGQISAEIGASKSGIIRQDGHIRWQDKPRPRVYWYDKDWQGSAPARSDEDETVDAVIANFGDENLNEHDLYPILIQYLKSEHGLLCLRIDEKKSRNQRGQGGNRWLHPDIVAMEPVAKDWDELVKGCVLKGAGQSVRLWSFEVKKELTKGNVRECFFQAVSNSSWANEGYLVATLIADPLVEQELRMLSALHGIGVILLNPANPSESDVILPAKAKQDPDWQSINRLVIENDDMREFVDQVYAYFQTGRIKARDWNRP